MERKSYAAAVAERNVHLKCRKFYLLPVRVNGESTPRYEQMKKESKILRSEIVFEDRRALVKNGKAVNKGKRGKGEGKVLPGKRTRKREWSEVPGSFS